MDELTRKTWEAIREHAMLAPGDKVIVGLSGGPDSTALLCILHELMAELQLGGLVAFHVNHRLRGEESDGDEAWARQLAESLAIPFEAAQCDVAALAARQGVSLELAGRQARARALEEGRIRCGAQKIALAHHRDDQAETVLMRILRGTGTRGLGGIRPVSARGVRIRPLLSASREEIEAYCRERGLRPRTDRSNFDTVFTRNRVRLDLLPKLEADYNPGVREALLRLSRQAAEADDLVNRLADEFRGALDDTAAPRWQRQERTLDLQSFSALHPAVGKRVLLLAAESLRPEEQVSAAVLEQLYEVALGPEPAEADLGGGRYARKSYGKLWFLERGDGGEAAIAEALPVPWDALEAAGTLTVSAGGREVTLTILERTAAAQALLEEVKRPQTGSRQIAGEGAHDSIPLRKTERIYLDYDALRACPYVVLRNRRAGDRIRPIGMRGSKKLQDFLTDRKLPRHLRDSLPLLAAGDRILLAGGEVAADCAVTEATKRLLSVQYTERGR